VSLYGRVFAAMYDRSLAATEDAGLRERRAALLRDARGRVLEIGAGTGLNLPHYGEAVATLVLAEPEPAMAARLRARAAALPAGAPPVEVVDAPAERLPFPDGSFDTVVSTLVLCTVRDQPAALAEIRRVLAPGGVLLFLEHVRAEDPGLARWQDRLDPLWRHVGHGCRCNRDTAAALAAAGLRAERLERGRLPKAAPLVRPAIEGVARPG
jgi:ubiquinone/menaquinone biosynthesis C-methylase UbiE